MKKTILVISAAFICMAAVAQKGDGGKQNVVKVNPLGILFGVASVGYERVLDAKSSVQFNAYFGGLSVAGNKYTNLGAGVDYRRYFGSSSEAPKGFYVSPGVGVLNTKVKVGSSNGTATGVSLKAVAGNQWVFGSGFVIDLNGGIQYTNITPKINGVNYDKYSGVYPAIGFSLGYAF